MKKTSLIAIAVLGAFTLGSCGEEKKNNNEAPDRQNDIRMDAVDTAGAGKNLDNGEVTLEPEFEDEAVAAVYDQYLEIKTALVNTNAEEAGKAAENMGEALKEAGVDEAGIEAARVIAENEDINAKRTAFSDLSASVEELVKGAVTSGEVYKQYCPMAFEGAGGYWLSTSEEIRNPYYGDKMLKCGRVEDTLQ